MQYVRALEQLLENKGHKINPHRSDAKIKPVQQRGGRSLPQVISEFAKVKTVTLTTVPSTDHKTCIQSSIGDIPKGSKIFRTEAPKGGKFICVFGIFREMCEFVELSKQLLHPFDLLTNVPDVLIQCIFNVVTLGPIESMKHRVNALKKWQRWAKELQLNEDRLHHTMDRNLQRCLHGKRRLRLEN